MCFLGRGTHITSIGIRVSQVGEHISLGIYVSQVGEHISLGIPVSQVGEHILLGIYVSQVGEHITLGICVPVCRVLGFTSFTFLKSNHPLILACEQNKLRGEEGKRFTIFSPFPKQRACSQATLIRPESLCYFLALLHPHLLHRKTVTRRLQHYTFPLLSSSAQSPNRECCSTWNFDLAQTL